MSDSTDLAVKKRKAQAALRAFEKRQQKLGIDNSLHFFEPGGQRLLLPSGIPTLDFLLGGRTGTTPGGFPKGTFTLIGGRQGSCKSTLALKTAHETVTNNGIPGYYNLEHSFDPDYALKVFEGDEAALKNLLIGNSQDLEAALDGTMAALKTGVMDTLIFDTVNGIAARGESKDRKGLRSMADKTVAEIPRVLSQFFRRAAGTVSKSNTAVILLGQVRIAGIGSAYVHDHISGGNALMHYTRLEIHQRRGSAVKDSSGKVVGFILRWKVLQAQVGHGINEGDELDTVFFRGRGFDPDYEVLNLAYQLGFVYPTGKSTMEYLSSQGDRVRLSGSKSYLPTSVLQSVKKADGVAQDMSDRIKQHCLRYHSPCQESKEYPFLETFLSESVAEALSEPTEVEPDPDQMTEAIAKESSPNEN